MDKQNLNWLKGEKNWYFRRKQEVVESLIIGSCLNVGCGEHRILNACNVDLPNFDATNKKCWEKYKEYDTVVLSDVIEHLYETDRLLTLGNALSSFKKRLIITVPAYTWLYCKYDRLLGHYIRFNSLNIGNYGVQTTKHLFGALLPLFILRKLLNKGETPRLPRWLDNLFYKLSKINLPFGSTLLVIIDK